jgi:hypothetical protein
MRYVELWVFIRAFAPTALFATAFALTSWALRDHVADKNVVCASSEETSKCSELQQSTGVKHPLVSRYLARLAFSVAERDVEITHFSSTNIIIVVPSSRSHIMLFSFRTDTWPRLTVALPFVAAKQFL